MSIQPETEQQHIEVERAERPTHGCEFPAPPRLSEGQLKLVLTEMAESDLTFLEQLFKSAASTKDGPSSSPSKAGHSPSPAMDGADNLHGSFSHGLLGKPAPLPTPMAEHLDCVLHARGSKFGSLARRTRPGCGPTQQYILAFFFFCVFNLYLKI